MDEVRASELKLGDLFGYDGQVWQHCGWYSAVCHICGLGLNTGEKRVISCHSFVTLLEETKPHLVITPSI